MAILQASYIFPQDNNDKISRTKSPSALSLSTPETIFFNHEDNAFLRKILVLWSL